MPGRRLEMKSKLLSIFSDSNQQVSVTEPSADTQPSVASYRGRYQAFLNQQTPVPQTNHYQTTSVFRLFQGLFSLVIFVVLFVTILTLFGFGLSSLGVIAQVSSAETSAASHESKVPDGSPSPAHLAPKKKSRAR